MTSSCTSARKEGLHVGLTAYEQVYKSHMQIHVCVQHNIKG